MAGHFIKVPIALLDAVADPGSDLDGLAILVWIALKSFADFGSEEGAVVRDQVATARAGCSWSTFKRRRKSLQESGWLDWQSNAGRSNRYIVRDAPEIGQRELGIGQSDLGIAQTGPPGSVSVTHIPRVKVPRTNTYAVDFEEMWATYPRKIGKVAAQRAWTATRRRGVESETLQRSASQYASVCQIQGTEQKYIKHPGTFFGPDEPWQDYSDEAVDAYKADFDQSRAELDAIRNAGASRE